MMMLLKTTRYLALLGLLVVTASVQAQPADEVVEAQPAEEAKKPAANGHADHKADAPKRAVAVLIPIGESKTSGVVYFTQNGDKARIQGRIRGLTPGKHGFHVHEFGDLSDLETGNSAGGYFNPEGHEHGRPDDRERHAGDLGNIEANEEGVAEIDMQVMLQLSGPHGILGRSLVVHAGEDKFTQPTGDAGGRVAVGIIGIAGKQAQARQ